MEANDGMIRRVSGLCLTLGLGLLVPTACGSKVGVSEDRCEGAAPDCSAECGTAEATCVEGEWMCPPDWGESDCGECSDSPPQCFDAQCEPVGMAQECLEGQWLCDLTEQDCRNCVGPAPVCVAACGSEDLVGYGICGLGGWLCETGVVYDPACEPGCTGDAPICFDSCVNGDEIGGAICFEGGWVCESGVTVDDCSAICQLEPPRCVDGCGTYIDIGPASCSDAEDWTCDKGVLADQCGDPPCAVADPPNCVTSCDASGQVMAECGAEGWACPEGSFDPATCTDPSTMPGR